MIKVRSLAALLAVSSIAVLPACSMFGGGDSGRRSSSVGGAGQGYAAAPSYSSSPQASAPAAMPPLTPEMIRSVQQTLQQNGMYRGQIDGVWGPGTQSAVRSYQQAHNLNATGQLDQDTLTAMNLTGNQNSAQQQQPPASQRYGSNYNPPPNDNPQPAPPNAPR